MVAFVLPAPGSRILTRELLYTAVTRAQERLLLVGPEESIRSAIAAPDRPRLRPAARTVGRPDRGGPDLASIIRPTSEHAVRASA